MEIRIKCIVKNLKLHEIGRTISQNEVADFSGVEYQRSATLRNAIRDDWVEVLKKAKTAAPRPKGEPKDLIKEEPKDLIKEEAKKKEPKGKKRGRKPKSE